MQSMTSKHPQKREALEALKKVSMGRKVTNVKFEARAHWLHIEGDCFTQKLDGKWNPMGRFIASIPTISKEA